MDEVGIFERLYSITTYCYLRTCCIINYYYNFLYSKKSVKSQGECRGLNECKEGMFVHVSDVNVFVLYCM
jgi:hypothetical protein